MGKILAVLFMVVFSSTALAQGISIGVGPGGISIGFDPGHPSERDRVCFFEHVGYQGASYCVRAGERDANLNRSGWANTISSVWIEGDASVELYQDINYGGQSIGFDRSVPDLRAYSFYWNDLASSFRTRAEGHVPPPEVGRACFFEGPNFTGESFCVRAGRQKGDLARTGWSGRISSVRIEGRASVNLFERARFEGRSIWLTESVSRLRRSGWNDRAASLEVIAYEN